MTILSGTSFLPALEILKVGFSLRERGPRGELPLQPLFNAANLQRLKVLRLHANCQINPGDSYRLARAPVIERLKTLELNGGFEPHSTIVALAQSHAVGTWGASNCTSHALIS